MALSFGPSGLKLKAVFKTCPHLIINSVFIVTEYMRVLPSSVFGATTLIGVGLLIQELLKETPSSSAARGQIPKGQRLNECPFVKDGTSSGFQVQC